MQHRCKILRPIYKIMSLDSVEIVSREKDWKTKTKQKKKKNQQNHSWNITWIRFSSSSLFFLSSSSCFLFASISDFLLEKSERKSKLLTSY